MRPSRPLLRLRRSRLAPLVLRLALAASPVVTAACQLDIFRLRSGTPLAEERYEDLRVASTTLAEALDRLGAPDRLEWKSGADYLWYEYADEVDVGLRFRVPTSAFGYQHNFLRLSENSENLNSMQLVFNDGVLTEKSLRLPDVYEARAGAEARGWKFHLAPRFGYGLLLHGDAGVRDFDRLFDDGFRAGLDLGFQPVPAFTFVVGGSYQEHQGDAFFLAGDRVALGDLQLYQLELGIRFETPLRLLTELDDFDEVKRVLFSEDLDAATGVHLYVEGTTGVTVNGNVPVKINGERRGKFYDDDVLFSGTIGAGLGYSWSWGALSAGVTYGTIDPFNKGNSPLDDDADSLQALFAGGGLRVRF